MNWFSRFVFGQNKEAAQGVMKESVRVCVLEREKERECACE